jgi:hypothetical protein
MVVLLKDMNYEWREIVNTKYHFIATKWLSSRPIAAYTFAEVVKKPRARWRCCSGVLLPKSGTIGATIV